MPVPRRWILAFLLSGVVMIGGLAVPGQARAALSSSVTGAVDIASGHVTIQGKTDAGALVAINGRQLRADAAGVFAATSPLAGTVTIAVVGTVRPGFSVLLGLPSLPSVAVHVLPVVTFSYDGTSRMLGLAGRLTRKPAGAVKGYMTDTETRGSTSFTVGKDYRFSTALRLGVGLNTLCSYVRYLLLVRYTLPQFTATVGPVPQAIMTLQVGNPHMTVNGVVRTVDAQGTRPFVSNGTTMVPIRAFIESLGGALSWDDAARRVDIRLGSRAVTMWVGETTAQVNGRNKTMSVAPLDVGGHVMVPLRFAAESLGCLIGWSQSTQAITVVYGG